MGPYKIRELLIKITKTKTLHHSKCRDCQTYGEILSDTYLEIERMKMMTNNKQMMTINKVIETLKKFIKTIIGHKSSLYRKISQER